MIFNSKLNGTFETIACINMILLQLTTTYYLNMVDVKTNWLYFILTNQSKVIA